MNFRTFFSLLFLISITLCIGSTFFTDILKEVMQYINFFLPIKFIGIASLLTAIFSYIGMLVSFYFAEKREKRRIEKLKEDRELIDSIHAEIEALKV
jgi:predicted membrane protein